MVHSGQLDERRRTPSAFVGFDDFTYTVSDGISSSTATVDIFVAQTTPSLVVTDAGGTYDSSPFAATATIAGTITGVDDSPASSLQGVTPTVTYYVGSGTSGTELSGAPTTAGTYTVLASFAGSTDYTSATDQTTFTIGQATPTITWNNPPDIFVGTALDDTQLDATANTAGSFVYTPAAGTVLAAGSGQTLSVSFTPTDSVDYTTATQTVSINVATPQDAAYSTIHDVALTEPASGGLLTSVQYANAGALSVSAVNGTALDERQRHRDRHVRRDFGRQLRWQLRLYAALLDRRGRRIHLHGCGWEPPHVPPTW